jgi:5'-nucleotidase
MERQARASMEVNMIDLNNVGLFDQDGSLVDYVGGLRRCLLEYKFSRDYDLTDLWVAEKKYPEVRRAMREIKSRPGWWRDLAPIPAGMRVFRLAGRIGFYRMVLTKGPTHHPLAWGEKLEWSRNRLGKKIPVTITENKGFTYGKFLYDDFPDYATGWLAHRPNGLVIMPENDLNRSFSHPQVLKHRRDNFDEVEHALVCCFNRKPGEPLVL